MTGIDGMSDLKEDVACGKHFNTFELNKEELRTKWQTYNSHVPVHRQKPDAIDIVL